MFSYGDGASELINQMREEIDDTRQEPDGVYPDGHNFSDQTLLTLHAAEGLNLGRLTARCCEILARAYARYPTASRMGPVGESVAASKHYRLEAARLRQLHGYSSNTRHLGAQSVPVEVVI